MRHNLLHNFAYLTDGTMCSSNVGFRRLRNSRNSYRYTRPSNNHAQVLVQSQGSLPQSLGRQHLTLKNQHIQHSSIDQLEIFMRGGQGRDGRVLGDSAREDEVRAQSER